MAKDKMPSKVQAQRLARLLLDDRQYLPVTDGFMPATDRAIVKRAWVSDSGEDYTYPSGLTARKYKINCDGLWALERYIREMRFAMEQAKKVA